jgi:hypothetical protein
MGQLLRPLSLSGLNVLLVPYFSGKGISALFPPAARHHGFSRLPRPSGMAERSLNFIKSDSMALNSGYESITAYKNAAYLKEIRRRQ